MRKYCCKYQLHFIMKSKIEKLRCENRSRVERNAVLVLLHIDKGGSYNSIAFNPRDINVKLFTC